MARLAPEAEADIDRLTDHYLEAKGRPEAARNLASAVQAALARLDKPRVAWRAHPPGYPGIADAGLRWVKVHRYWFAYRVEGGEAVVRRVLYESANIPARLTSGS